MESSFSASQITAWTSDHSSQWWETGQTDPSWNPIGNISSQVLSQQHWDFHKALGAKGESEVFCFYETIQSPTAIKVYCLDDL